MNKILIFTFSLLYIFYPNISKGEFYIPDPPKKIFPIQDYAGVLSKQEINYLNKKLINYYNNTSVEILVAVINDNYGDDPNMIAQKWGEKWKIGSSVNNNGIIILLSTNDRTISIQNGYGLEYKLTDILTTKIIQKVTPLLKNRFYYRALDKCINEIYNHYQDKKIKNITKKKKTFVYNILFPIIMIIIFFLFFMFNENISLLETIFMTNLFFSKDNDNNENDDEDNFEGFGGGGHFGGGGSSDTW